MKRLLITLLLILGCCQHSVAGDTVYEADICVYGGTASGVTAALAAARRGQKVLIVEPFRHLGGMHGGGIRIQTDCLYLKDIGGIARELHDADYALLVHFGVCHRKPGRVEPTRPVSVHCQFCI